MRKRIYSVDEILDELEKADRSINAAENRLTKIARIVSDQKMVDEEWREKLYLTENLGNIQVAMYHKLMEVKKGNK
jgi:histone deacetylase complex regulatory component SIN3